MMEALDREHPGYGFAAHKGYPTAEHREAFLKLGPCPHHRMSFPVSHEMLGEYAPVFYTLREKLFASETRDALSFVLVDSIDEVFDAAFSSIGTATNGRVRAASSKGYEGSPTPTERIGRT